MSTEVAIAYICFAGIVIGLFVYYALDPYGDAKKRLAERWMAGGGMTEGYLLEGKLIQYADPREHRGNRYRVVYGYEANGEKYKATRYFENNYPTVVGIYYNPEKPNVWMFHCEVGTKRPVRRILIAVGAAVVSIAAMMIVLL